MSAGHADNDLQIFQAGREAGHATFETAAPDSDVFDAEHPLDYRQVALDRDDAVAGWAAAAPVSSRCVYGGVIESSLYIDRTTAAPGSAPDSRKP